MELPSLIIPFLLLLFTVAYSYGLALFHRRKLPPGPIGLPIFKNLFDIGAKPHESLAKLAKKHGPLMTITLGSFTTIVASSPKMAREILQKRDEVFSGRKVPDSMAELELTDNAIAWISTGELWRTMRLVLSTSLMNQQKLDSLRDLRHNVVDEMVQHVKLVANRGQLVDIGKLAFTTNINHLSNTCFSVNVADYESQNFEGFLNAVKTIMKIDAKFNIGDYIPFLRGLDLQGIRRKSKASYGCLEELCDKHITKRLKDREFKLQRCGDLLDSFLDYSQENESQFNLKDIHVLLMELFLAGTETSSVITEWAITELIRHPSIMEKVRLEITEKLGEGRMEEAVILGLPYLQAVVKETLRLHLPVPLLLPHKTETDVSMYGYEIPKNTQVLVNAWAISRDPEYWENPTCFRPERFLDSELDFKGQHFSFLPFSSGRRTCPALPLAHRIVSLMIASLVYHFHWKLPFDITPEKLDMNKKFGLTLQKEKPLVLVPSPIRR
ncbi:hypothetical protein LguiA_033990 [Lonicera macranthoides]